MERMGTLMNTSQQANEPELHRLFNMLHGATEHPSRVSQCGDSVDFSRRPVAGTKTTRKKAGLCLELGVGIVNGGTGAAARRWG